MKKYFNLDFDALVVLLLPTFLRGRITVALLRAFVRPLSVLHGRFLDYSNSLAVETGAKVCYMQALLTDEFDYFQRRIKIRPCATDADSLLLHKEILNKPLMLPKEGSEGHAPFLLNRDGQIGSNAADFEVVLPVFFYLSSEEKKRMKTLVNRNKLTTKKYAIVNGQN